MTKFDVFNDKCGLTKQASKTLNIIVSQTPNFDACNDEAL